MKEFDTALAKGASRVPVLLARATVYSDKQDYEKAIAECTTLLVSHPDCVSAYLLQATAFEHQNQPENAEKACTDGLKYAKKPEEKAHLLLERGYALARMHKTEEAEKDLSAAIELSPTVPMYMARGDVYKKLNKYSEAIDDYGAVIERDPANYNALVARAIVETRNHDEKAALADFAEALKINKMGVEAYIQRGSLYLSRHAYHLAVNDFEDAMRLNPQIAETQQKRDFAYKQLRMATPKLTYAMPESSNSNVDATVGIASKLKLPGTTPELLKVGYKYLNDGELQFAIACFRQAVKMEPSNENARKYLAHAYFEAGESAGAAEQFEALNHISGVDPADILPFSQSLARSGRTSRAIQVLESYLATNPRATNYRCDLANLYLEAKQPARAKMVIAQGLAVPGLSASDRQELMSLYQNSIAGSGAKPGAGAPGPTPVSAGRTQ
jgi:tetratricopeptide (TPR) repeat protein